MSSESESESKEKTHEDGDIPVRRCVSSNGYKSSSDDTSSVEDLVKKYEGLRITKIKSDDVKASHFSPSITGAKMRQKGKPQFNQNANKSEQYLKPNIKPLLLPRQQSAPRNSTYPPTSNQLSRTGGGQIRAAYYLQQIPMSKNHKMNASGPPGGFTEEEFMKAKKLTEQGLAIMALSNPDRLTESLLLACVVHKISEIGIPPTTPPSANSGFDDELDSIVSAFVRRGVPNELEIILIFTFKVDHWGFFYAVHDAKPAMLHLLIRHAEENGLQVDWEKRFATRCYERNVVTMLTLPQLAVVKFVNTENHRAILDLLAKCNCALWTPILDETAANWILHQITQYRDLFLAIFQCELNKKPHQMFTYIGDNHNNNPPPQHSLGSLLQMKWAERFHQRA